MRVSIDTGKQISPARTDVAITAKYLESGSRRSMLYALVSAPLDGVAAPGGRQDRPCPMPTSAEHSDGGHRYAVPPITHFET
ncbi:hypothetical protein, partial [Nocardia sp. NPDC005366]|uniref:hypothetical protein n=1 Tax=Nocardia sp. NPDC005366 TaxID=3156878 RepID=UPI0033AD6E53